MDVIKAIEFVRTKQDLADFVSHLRSDFMNKKVSDCIFPQAAFYGARENVVWHLFFLRKCSLTPFL